MERSLKMQLQQDLGKKLLIVSGPRQVGKTTLSKSLGEDYEYLNFDDFDDRKTLFARNFNIGKKILICDIEVVSAAKFLAQVDI